MNNRTLWTIVGVVLLVVIGLLVFNVISIPTKVVTDTSTSAQIAAKIFTQPSTGLSVEALPYTLA